MLGVEYFEHGRRGVAAEIGRHLVDLVEQHHGIARAGLAHGLDHLAGQRAEVGPAMAANFGLVAHPAQRNPHKLASGRPRHRFAKRGLADARRSNQA